MEDKRVVQMVLISPLYDYPALPIETALQNNRDLRVAADWRRLDSRYDALLAANLNPDFPEDRRIMLTRCRAWGARD